MVTSFLVHHSARQLSYFYRNADPFVQKMHDDNGLWRDLVDNRLVQLSLTEIDDHMAGELSSYGEGPHYFVGNSIRLDRGFIELYLPRFASLLHYRQIDLSSTELMLQAKGKTSNGDKTGDHRAADDVLDSIKQLNRQLDLL
jgi:oligoribonuclease (3'-5' exoribonuclease)